MSHGDYYNDCLENNKMESGNSSINITGGTGEEKKRVSGNQEIRSTEVSASPMNDEDYMRKTIHYGWRF